tara:strand:- start:212 stop:838 length:627 start_codon:yes stop_codon:yes gene_type:complete
MSDETTPTLTPAAPAIAAPTQQPQTNGSIPRARLNEEISKRQEAFSTRDSALTRVADLEAQLHQAQSSLSQTQTTNSQEMHLMGLGFKAESVRRFFRREYQAAAQESGDSAPAFNDWLESSKADPLYSVHFDRMAPPTQQAPLAGTIAPASPATYVGNPDAGTSQPVVHQSREWTVEDIRRERAKSSGKLGAHRDIMIAQLKAQGIIS